MSSGTPAPDREHMWCSRLHSVPPPFRSYLTGVPHSALKDEHDGRRDAERHCHELPGLEKATNVSKHTEGVHRVVSRLTIGQKKR